ncbi:hypothetical protein SAMN04488123_108104 [Natribacillus halophilus]|uniref:Uncharacterized protein n=1 Tax=Natribacillus halophilus TaxID=549003 RepID=A0A1G8PFG5_9BACI|nr:hypothetical protein SAMN04488123_108104 [Natribacillus halophilus]
MANLTRLINSGGRAGQTFTKNYLVFLNNNDFKQPRDYQWRMHGDVKKPVISPQQIQTLCFPYQAFNRIIP